MMSCATLDSYNRYPDEKGTESHNAESRISKLPPHVTTVSPMKRGLKVIEGKHAPDDLMSYNRYPDEKGTERLGQLLGGTGQL